SASGIPMEVNMSAPTTSTRPGELTYEVLRDAVEGGAAAFRCRRRLQPIGGPGDKVFPPTFAGAVYATEQRRLPGYAAPVTCVLLDSVQSQANRMEQALQDAVDAREISIPIIEVDFSSFEPTGKEDGDKNRLLSPIGKITSLQVPHRLADAILRDSEYLEPDGTKKPFRKSSVGQPIDSASPLNATPIYELCPTALIFGMWDSTGPRGGLGAKFERALVSEIVGVGAELGDLTRGVRRDPLDIASGIMVVKLPDGDWRLARAETEGEHERTVAPSKVNHSSVPFPEKTEKNRYSGMTIEFAEQTTTISLIALRRLGFPRGSATAARTALAALGLCAATLAFSAGDDLRSRCALWPVEPMVWHLLEDPAAEPKRFSLDAKTACTLLAHAAAAAAKAGAPWRSEVLTLLPSPKLVELTRLSQKVRVSQEG
ncbi:MAG TPA: type I-U CRISPR-associated RAMP protein Csb1/Cas7u, partial [Stellaceae bacterium]|nr:type I-U CRISPR-associated RAMP protein Csb1/Cas7u [Stellaceae bacterium]